MVVLLAPPVAAATVKLPVYAKRLSIRLPVLAARTWARVYRWSRKSPVSTRSERLTMKRIGPSWTVNSAPASASRPYRGWPQGCGACVLVNTCSGGTSRTSTTVWNTASRSGCPPAARWARRGYSTR